ncbi:DEAD/DEAH box helicase [Bhargavaea beijingensis]|uniref:Competence protein ComFA n=1 Tax=Bhargavaea beijingensis TaxID=426756 RepID=A0A1G7BU40_9BACL|nr:DEAD/DEAH box helicase family protein [Bhargavaea beijingensis]MCW1926688.1 DEAD/DEAH box helicase family protein [Bhargavaea beijingensis]SDE30579.1 competence protein ComFA [Bhargavaea beijingensis]
MQGRIWLRELLPFGQGAVTELINDGLIGTIPGVTTVRKWHGAMIFRCNRCLTENPRHFHAYNCRKCGRICRYCRHCLNMGRVAECDELLYWCGPDRPSSGSVELTWKGRLTPLQERAAAELQESLLAGRRHLLHAVCGAGKTEILFRPVHRLLSEGKRVCIATPRTDVVLELLPRFTEAVGGSVIHGLYSGSGEPEGFPGLIIATTHQLYRFREAFDVVIVDEADAFPYSYDKTLRQAVKKSLKAGGVLAVVTATPSSAILSEIGKDGGKSVIPVRFHGYPLPEPRSEPLFGYRRKISSGKLPERLRVWTEECLKKKAPFLVFFPSVSLMEKSLPLFSHLDTGIGAVHASHPDRRSLVLALREGRIPGLLTTTILERGITIPRLQIAIVGSENAIFDRSAIIQISGRAGRSSEYPGGDVVLFHHGITPEMDSAVREIRQLNREGGKLVGMPAL